MSVVPHIANEQALFVVALDDDDPDALVKDPDGYVIRARVMASAHALSYRP